MATANKRVSNILKKSESTIYPNIDITLLIEQSEKNLYATLTKIVPEAEKQFAIGDYAASLQTLAVLRSPVDNFFENVMVNINNENIKNNRISLLLLLNKTMNKVANLEKLSFE